MTIRTLVLSGGGGRGAFHAGVYQYLCAANKGNVDADHRDPWLPDIVVGTSIGAVNGAAIVQGITSDELVEFWLSLREKDIQGLPPGMGWLTRRAVNWFLKHSIGTGLPRVEPAQSTSPDAIDSWPAMPIVSPWLSNRLIGNFSNLLDTGPLKQTLMNRLKLDEAKIAASQMALLISATNVRTGEGVTFANHESPHLQKRGDQILREVRGITLDRIIASCSIPIVYPWTKDGDGELYWDGALVANTPMGAAFDVVRDRPMDEPMEVVVVMMNPWWEKEGEHRPRQESLPGDLGEAITWTLDWTLLASFRVSLKMMRAMNRIAELDKVAGRTPIYRYASEVIVAPDRFLPVERIIDYDQPASRDLIELGYQAAQSAFQRHFGAVS